MTARPAILGAVLAMLVAACSSAGAARTTSAPPTASPADLTIFAAASLKNVLAEAETAYEAAHPGTDLTISTDSSAALATQIEQGAPVDVFLSADTTNPQKLVDGGFAIGAAIPFAGNRLTVIVPADNPGGIRSPVDLAKDGVRIIAAGDEVPITRYATRLVENLGQQPDAPAGFAAAYAANVASKEDNVGQVVAKIELGEGDAGIVYVTDAAASDEVTPIDVPDAANVSATYAGVVVGESTSQDAATAFLDWLTGPDGQAVLSSFGFQPPP